MRFVIQMMTVSVQKTATQGVLDSCHWLVSGYRLRLVIVPFPTIDHF